MNYKIAISKRPAKKGKAITFGYRNVEIKSIEQLIEVVNTHAWIPATLSGSRRRKDFITSIAPLMRFDLDAENEVARMEEALKNYEYIKKPSTSNDGTSYKWHLIVFLKKAPKDYEQYKLTYEYVINNILKVKLSDNKIKSPATNMNFRGEDGIANTTYHPGKKIKVPKLKKPKIEKTSTPKGNQPSKKQVWEIMKNLPPQVVRDSAGNRKFPDDAGIGYLEFTKIGMALYNWSGGSDKGLKLWRKWAYDTNQYYSDQIDHKWADFATNITGNVTIGTLKHLAGQTGESAAPEEEGEALDASKYPKTVIQKKKPKKPVEMPNEDELGLEYNPEDFPDSISDYMQEACDNLGVSFNAAVPFTLCLASQFIGAKVKIQSTSNWVQTPILWGINVAGPSTGKSPVIGQLRFPMDDYNRKHHSKYLEEMEEYQADLAYYNSMKQQDREGEPRPQKPKYITMETDQITNEALFEVLESNPNGVMSWSDELKELFVKEDDNSKMKRSYLMRSWDGKNPITYTTKSAGKLRIERPYMRVGGSVQPEVAKQILDNNKSGSNADGFIARFQIISHFKITRNIYRDKISQPNPFAVNAYADTFQRLLNRGDIEHPEIVKYSKKAMKSKENYLADIIDAIQNNESTNSFEAEFLGKIPATFGALVGVMHVLEDVKGKVQPDTVQRAINIMEVARANATYLYDTARRDKQEEENASLIIKDWLSRSVGKKHLGESGQSLSASRIANNYFHKKVTVKQVVDYFNSLKNYSVLTSGSGKKVIKN